MPAGAKPGERRGGRKPGVPNKATRELREIAGAYTEQAVKELVRIMTKSESDAARVSAVKELFDRSHGKAPQAHTGEGGGGPIEHLVRWLRDGEATE